MTPARLLHVFSTFNLGGAQARAVQLMNAWGDAYQHQIVSVTAGERAASERLLPNVVVSYPEFPNLKTGSLGSRLWKVRACLRQLKPDLVLTYNWGAMEVVMANRLFALAPLVHHEDGFGPDEATRQLPRRVWFRRLALPGAAKVVVPSRTLEALALGPWRQPPSRVVHVPNGVDVSLYDKVPSPLALPGLDRRDGVLQVGTVAGLRPEKNLCRLVRVFAEAARGLNARLVIVGMGPERNAILAEAASCGISDRVHLTGFLPDPHLYMGLFDVFALSSDTEQFPISLVEAMAAGLPAVCTDVGDIRRILPNLNHEYVRAAEEEGALSVAMRVLLNDSGLRKCVGEGNRTVAVSEYSLSRMISAYQAIYFGSASSMASGN